MDFGGLPPEINSARMYTGPGSMPMTAAASAWNGLAVELDSAATCYETLITQLTGEEWLGPASTAMADAVTPYVVWTRAAAAQAEQTAMQARASAAAYETALAAMVPPPQILANRMQLAELRSTNIYGHNSAAIAALEAEYGQMWAQDAAAMYEYAAANASATRLTPFEQPPHIVNPAAGAGQGAAVAHAAATAAGPSQSALARLISGIPQALSGLSGPIASHLLADNPLQWLWQILFGTTVFPTSIAALLTDLQPYASFFYNTEGLPYFSIGMANNFVQSSKTLGLLGGSTAAAASGAAQSGLAGLGGLLGSGGPVSASMGHSSSLGRLSVPPSWAGAGPQPEPMPVRMPIETLKFTPDAAAGSGNMLGGMPLAGPGHSASGSGPRYGVRPTVMARPPFAG
ncbi:hypothetical protein BST12_03105 [Mycobacterium angelicum]|uniref:PPE family protein n=1 Tax=Mycobacterium angelicum TaxID=470074 RepID=A0A1X0A5D7_MYCAN|nr:PPE family protein [Mycobacterium angelicum]ORA25291.1 hypothetical protein BST12_03105 [Mycobacterium angelicum]